MDWLAIGTAFVTAYAAGFGTYAFWANRRDQRRRLRVEMSHAIAPHPITDIESLVLVTVSNPGYHNATVTSVALELPGQRQLVFPNPRTNKSLPCELTPGTNLVLFNNARLLAQSLREAGLQGAVPAALPDRGTA